MWSFPETLTKQIALPRLREMSVDVYPAQLHHFPVSINNSIPFFFASPLIQHISAMRKIGLRMRHFSNKYWYIWDRMVAIYNLIIGKQNLRLYIIYFVNRTNKLSLHTKWQSTWLWRWYCDIGLKK